MDTESLEKLSLPTHPGRGRVFWLGGRGKKYSFFPYDKGQEEKLFLGWYVFMTILNYKYYTFINIIVLLD